MTEKMQVVQPAPVPDQDATAAVRARLGDIERLSQVLPAVQAAAAELEGIYLVGGAVRDLLLGEQSVDLDLMVEGDALEFSRRLARELGASARMHERFETAVVAGPRSDHAEMRIDVASARTETYVTPGALPEVARATLREDLARRDFTINALATSLGARDLGATFDPSGGFRDLEARTVRVLHDCSFTDDPTRLLRALRYEARLGFRMDDHTMSLASACMGSGLLRELGSARLRDELLDLLDEHQAPRAIERMGELGADHALHPGLDAGPRAVELAAEAGSAMASAPFSEARAGLARLACLCAAITPEEIRAWLEWICMPGREREIVVAAITAGPRIAARLASPPPPRPSELRELLEGLPIEALVFAIALSPDHRGTQQLLAAYVERIRDTALSINGDDLRQFGVPESPELGRALRTTLGLKLDGFVRDRDEELATALRLLGVPPR